MTVVNEWLNGSTVVLANNRPVLPILIMCCEAHCIVLEQSSRICTPTEHGHHPR